MNRARRQKIVATALSDLGASVVLSALITLIMAAVGALRDPALLSGLFVGNLVLSGCITLSIELGFACTVEAEYARDWPKLGRLAMFASAFLACVLLGIELALRMIANLVPGMAQLFPRDAVALVALPVSAVMIAVGALRDQRERARAAEKQAQQQLGQARLSALSARTHPHFLFNSLNGIAELIEADPKAGERAVIELSRLFRYVLEGSDATLVPLRGELEFVRGYLAMESLRFGERLVNELDVPAELLDLPVPPLLLQPLVENAVRHGTSRQEALRVRIEGRAERGQLVLTVDDDGPGPEGSEHRGSGTSHRDLRARLALAYGKDARLDTARSPLGGFRAQVRLPREPA